jgi:hypothetical protein
VLTEGLGKVLFVDEAYRLNGDMFMKEAVNELVQVIYNFFLFSPSSSLSICFFFPWVGFFFQSIHFFWKILFTMKEFITKIILPIPLLLLPFSFILAFFFSFFLLFSFLFSFTLFYSFFTLFYSFLLFFTLFYSFFFCFFLFFYHYFFSPYSSRYSRNPNSKGKWL